MLETSASYFHSSIQFLLETQYSIKTTQRLGKFTARQNKAIVPDLKSCVWLGPISCQLVLYGEKKGGMGISRDYILHFSHERVI